MEILKTVTDNLVFVLEFLGIVAVIFLISWLIEKNIKKKNGSTERIFSTRKIVIIGMFSALSAVLMILEMPVPFAPPFYKLDFSELPALIGGFAFGPVVGVMIEFCKIVLKVLIKGSSTAFVGELANFLVGCFFILPASICYLFKKNKKQAVIATVVGTIMMASFGTAFNGIYLLPKFAQLFGMPLESIIAMGTAVNPAVDSVTTLVIMCVAPLNLLKGGLVSAITLLIYKKISPVLKAGR